MGALHREERRVLPEGVGTGDERARLTPDDTGSGLIMLLIFTAVVLIVTGAGALLALNGAHRGAMH